MINARGGLVGRVGKTSGRAFDLRQNLPPPPRPTVERFPDLKPGFNKPACCAVLIGLIIFMGGLAMTILGYYAQELSDVSATIDSQVEIVRDTTKYSHLYSFRIVGPIIMGCGIFTVLCACVVLQEAREKKQILFFPQDKHDVPAVTKSSIHRSPHIDPVAGTSGISTVHTGILKPSLHGAKCDNLAVSIPSLVVGEDCNKKKDNAVEKNKLTLSERLAISRERFQVPSSPVILIHRSDLAQLTPVDQDTKSSHKLEPVEEDTASHRAAIGSIPDPTITRASSIDSSHGDFTDSMDESPTHTIDGEQRSVPGGMDFNDPSWWGEGKEKSNLLQATLTTTRRLSITSMLSASTTDSTDEEILLKATVTMEDVTTQKVVVPNKHYSKGFSHKPIKTGRNDVTAYKDDNIPGNSDCPVIFVNSHDEYSPKHFHESSKDAVWYEDDVKRRNCADRAHRRRASGSKHNDRVSQKRDYESRRNRRFLVRQDEHLDLSSSESDMEEPMGVNRAYKCHLQGELNRELNGNIEYDEVEMTTFEKRFCEDDVKPKSMSKHRPSIEFSQQSVREITL